MFSRKALSRGRQILVNQFSHRAWRGWRHMVVNHGWSAVPAAMAHRLRNKLHPAAPAAESPERNPDRQGNDLHPFDRDHGVDTGGLIWGEDLPSGSPNDAWNTAYYGIAPSIFHRVMAHLPETLRAGATFIDVGSGKGRAVMMAMQYSFRHIVGVEISPDLHRISVDNLKKYEGHDSSGRVRLLLQDASSFDFPAGPLVVYFFQPFCRPVLERVLQNLSQSFAAEPREIAVVYINPEIRDALDNCAFLERVWGERVALDEADYRADQIGSSGEDCAIYCARLPGGASPVEAFA